MGLSPFLVEDSKAVGQKTLSFERKPTLRL
jgi:hypothetical protein